MSSYLPKLIVVVVVGLLGVFYAKSTWRKSEVSTGLFVDPAALDLGEVFARPAVTCSIPLTNTSENTVRITNLRSTCECVSKSQFSALTLGAGERKSIDVVLDMSNALTQISKDPRRDFSATFMAKTDVADAPLLQFTVNAIIVANPLKPFPLVIDCGKLVEGEVWTPFRAEVDASDAGLLIEGCVANPNLDELSLSLSADKAKGMLAFKVPARSTPGSFREFADLRLSVTDKNRWKRVENPIIPVEIRADILPVIQAFPNKLLPGVIAVGDEYCDTISLIANRGTVSSIRVDADDAPSATVSPVVSGDHTSWQVRVRCKRPGVCEELFTFHVRVDQDSRDYEVLIPIKYRGVELTKTAFK